MKYLSEKYQNGDITLERYRELSKRWTDLIELFGSYPDMPYSSELNSILFEYVLDNSYSKEINFNRIKEWGAIYFIDFENVLRYENFNSGKIILKGYFEIPFLYDVRFMGIKLLNNTVEKAISTQTYVFTIKENKVKVEISGIYYEIIYTDPGIGVEVTYRRGIDAVYPVTQLGEGIFLDWDAKLSLLKNTKEQIEELVQSLDNYIKGYENDYDF